MPLCPGARFTVTCPSQRSLLDLIAPVIKGWVVRFRISWLLRIRTVSFLIRYRTVERWGAGRKGRVGWDRSTTSGRMPSPWWSGIRRLWRAGQVTRTSADRKDRSTRMILSLITGVKTGVSVRLQRCRWNGVHLRLRVMQRLISQTCWVSYSRVKRCIGGKAPSPSFQRIFICLCFAKNHWWLHKPWQKPTHHAFSIFLILKLRFLNQRNL